MYSIIYIYVVHTHINVLLGKKYINVAIIHSYAHLLAGRCVARPFRVHFDRFDLAISGAGASPMAPGGINLPISNSRHGKNRTNYDLPSPKKDVEGARRRIDSSLFWFVPCGFCLETTYLHGLSVFPSHLPTLGVSRLLGQRNEGHPCSSWVNPLFFLMVTSH